MLFLFVNVKFSITKLVSANIYIKTHIHGKLDLSLYFSHVIRSLRMRVTTICKLCATADEIHGFCRNTDHTSMFRAFHDNKQMKECDVACYCLKLHSMRVHTDIMWSDDNCQLKVSSNVDNSPSRVTVMCHYPDG